MSHDDHTFANWQSECHLGMTNNNEFDVNKYIVEKLKTMVVETTFLPSQLVQVLYNKGKLLEAKLRYYRENQAMENL